MRPFCCRRTVDHTGPYVRMLLERLRTPKSLTVMPPTPTAAGALEVPRSCLSALPLCSHVLRHHLHIPRPRCGGKM